MQPLKKAPPPPIVDEEFDAGFYAYDKSVTESDYLR